MKKPDFVSSFVDAVRRFVGWCPEAPEPKGLLKLVRLPLLYVPVFKVRLVQAGLIIGVSMQAIASVLGTIYITPAFFTLIEKILESNGNLPPEEVLSAFLSLILFAIIMLSITFLSSGMAGYTVGKISTKLRYGIIIGITNILLGLLVSSFIGLFYSYPFHTIYENLMNLNHVSRISAIDIVVGTIRTYSFFLSLGGGGGAIGQLLSLHLGRRRKHQDQEAMLHAEDVFQ